MPPLAAIWDWIIAHSKLITLTAVGSAFGVYQLLLKTRLEARRMKMHREEYRRVMAVPKIKGWVLFAHRLPPKHGHAILRLATPENTNPYWASTVTATIELQRIDGEPQRFFSPRALWVRDDKTLTEQAGLTSEHLLICSEFTGAFWCLARAVKDVEGINAGPAIGGSTDESETRLLDFVGQDIFDRTGDWLVIVTLKSTAGLKASEPKTGLKTFRKTSYLRIRPDEYSHPELSKCPFWIRVKTQYKNRNVDRIAQTRKLLKPKQR